MINEGKMSSAGFSKNPEPPLKPTHDKKSKQMLRDQKTSASATILHEAKQSHISGTGSRAQQWKQMHLVVYLLWVVFVGTVFHLVFVAFVPDALSSDSGGNDVKDPPTASRKNVTSSYALTLPGGAAVGEWFQTSTSSTGSTTTRSNAKRAGFLNISSSSLKKNQGVQLELPSLASTTHAKSTSASGFLGAVHESAATRTQLQKYDADNTNVRVELETDNDSRSSALASHTHGTATNVKTASSTSISHGAALSRSFLDRSVMWSSASASLLANMTSFTEVMRQSSATDPDEYSEGEQNICSSTLRSQGGSVRAEQCKTLDEMLFKMEVWLREMLRAGHPLVSSEYSVLGSEMMGEAAGESSFSEKGKPRTAVELRAEDYKELVIKQFKAAFISRIVLHSLGRPININGDEELHAKHVSGSGSGPILTVKTAAPVGPPRRVQGAVVLPVEEATWNLVESGKRIPLVKAPLVLKVSNVDTVGGDFAKYDQKNWLMSSKSDPSLHGDTAIWELFLLVLFSQMRPIHESTSALSEREGEDVQLHQCVPIFIKVILSRTNFGVLMYNFHTFSFVHENMDHNEAWPRSTANLPAHIFYQLSPELNLHYLTGFARCIETLAKFHIIHGDIRPDTMALHCDTRPLLKSPGGVAVCSQALSKEVLEAGDGIRFRPVFVGFGAAILEYSMKPKTGEDVPIHLMRPQNWVLGADTYINAWGDDSRELHLATGKGTHSVPEVHLLGTDVMMHPTLRNIDACPLLAADNGGSKVPSGKELKDPDPARPNAVVYRAGLVDKHSLATSWLWIWSLGKPGVTDSATLRKTVFKTAYNCDIADPDSRSSNAYGCLPFYPDVAGSRAANPFEARFTKQPDPSKPKSYTPHVVIGMRSVARNHNTRGKIQATRGGGEVKRYSMNSCYTSRGYSVEKLIQNFPDQLGAQGKAGALVNMLSKYVMASHDPKPDRPPVSPDPRIGNPGAPPPPTTEGAGVPADETPSTSTSRPAAQTESELSGDPVAAASGSRKRKKKSSCPCPGCCP
ncbi:unnamed protein product [Amoebophrya sp. A25]|nr:unnamed protein product [Amoebophrya sp. A25]|eukprot:GSA25T00004597001.1